MSRLTKPLVIIAAVAALTMSATPAALGARAPSATVGELTVERVSEPLGVDNAHPLFGWQVDAEQNGAAQSAYKIEVSRSEDFSDPVWDSGKAVSSRSYDVVYDGAALSSQTHYYWRVRVWHGHGAPTRWSETSTFETAFLDGDELGGSWIGSPNRAPEVPISDSSWIWYPEGDPTQTVPAGSRYFRTEIELPDGAEVTSAQVQITADDAFVLYANGERVLASADSAEAWRTVRVADIRAHLHEGANTLAVEATNGGGPFGAGGPAGLLAVVHVEAADGTVVETRTDETWRAADTETPGWQTQQFDDSAWPAAQVGARYGDGPWGNGASTPTPPEPLLRHGFAVAKQVRTARAYVSGLGYYKLYLNGDRVGRHELDPGFTVYDKTVLYSTYDVTDALSEGENVIAASLGRGYFGMEGPDEWTGEPWHDDTKLKLELLITFTDGTTRRVGSDTDWLTSDGPTTSESVWFGETYDARREQPGWNDTGFDDSSWAPAVVVPGPGGELRSQLFPAIEVTEDLPVVEVTEPVPGTFVFDFGRPTAGWADLALRGPAGARADMRYGEKLHDDGTVNNDNVYFTIQNYAYTLRGDGPERFRPSYSYAGFRYFQVTVPDGVTIDDVTGQRVHSAVERSGAFDSSSDLLNSYDAAQADTILNNLHSIPTDTPMYEKRAYGADAFLTADSAIAQHDMQTFYENWMRTHRDDQTSEGTFGNTVPGTAGAKAAMDDPVWSSSFVSITWDLYQYYGDERALAQNYDALKLWLDHYAEDIATTGGVYTGFSYGDWLSPAGANPPEGTSLVATAYLYQGAETMRRIASALGHDADAERFGALAAEIFASFNEAFYDDDAGAYFDDPSAGYRQTSNLLPLRFGLVPDELRDTVLDNLVRDIEDRDDHLNTGAIGTKELLPVLTENGYADLAFRVATNPTYPGWGYWFDELGATTMWEEWGEQSRSHDHTFLGTVVDWMYQDVAGIEPAAPGYTGITIRPHPMTGLDRAEATVDSPLGPISSSWTRTGESFTLDVTVPVGATADVHVPVRDGERVAVEPKLGASFVQPSGGDSEAVLVTVGSGDWTFVARQGR
jgi:alpha-L-rhamnosidase